jgi:hypothetical protein
MWLTNNTGNIVKLDLTTFTLANNISLPIGYDLVVTGVADQALQKAYFA